MTKVRVEISGAGETIHHEIYAIADLFKKHGYNVKINDEYPPEDTSDYGFQRDGKPITKDIEIIAHHLPWGG